MIKAIALDDEPLPLRLLQTFSARTGFVEMQATFTSPIEAARFIVHNTFDLIFLDIQMPGISGLDFLRTLPSGTAVIFTTAYSEYAVEGFNLNAVDYLLKPFEFNRFLQAAEKAREYIARRSGAEARGHVLFVKGDEGTERIDLDDVLYIEGVDNYVRIYRERRSPLLVRVTGKEMAGKLKDKGFIRVHRSYIIPVSRVVSVRNRIIYLGYAEIPVGIAYITQVQEIFRATTGK